jgi:hypothetical protein
MVWFISQLLEWSISLKYFLFFVEEKMGCVSGQTREWRTRIAGRQKHGTLSPHEGTCFIDALMPDQVSEDVKAWQKGGETTKKGAACEPV